jgi:hypothetical protein
MVSGRPLPPPVAVPSQYPTATIWMDESGSRASSGGFFVMVKVRNPGKLSRAIKTVRDRNAFGTREFKFAEVTRGTISAYYDLIDTALASEAHFAACVVNRSMADPFVGREPWQVHLEVASQLLCGCINRRELVAVCLDGITTPADVALDDAIRQKVNGRFKNTSVISAMCLDSKTHDGIQLADLFAGAVAYDRRQRSGGHGRHRATSSYKAKLSARLASGLGVTTFGDYRDRRLNIQTFGQGHPRSASQGVVPIRSHARVTG